VGYGINVGVEDHRIRVGSRRFLELEGVALTLDRPLDYLVPRELQGVIGPGALVACPLGPRRVVGVVVGTAPATHAGRLVGLAGRVGS